MAEPIDVLVVDDDPLVRSALAMVLGGDDGVRVVAEAADGDEVLDAVVLHDPDVVLMDIRMARVDGLVATRLLKQRDARPHVIILTTFHADLQVLQALRAGASGFLLKDTPPAEIVEAIHRVARGDAMLSPAVTRQLIAHVTDAEAETSADDSRRQQARTLVDRLSDREREVAMAVGLGLSNAQIAGRLYMSVATVKAHVSAILTKLDLTNRVQVALLAHDAGLL